MNINEININFKFEKHNFELQGHYFIIKNNSQLKLFNQPKLRKLNTNTSHMHHTRVQTLKESTTPLIIYYKKAHFGTVIVDNKIENAVPKCALL